MQITAICCVSKNDEILLDPNLKEETEARASVRAVFSNGPSARVISSKCVGNFAESEFASAMTLLRASATLIEKSFNEAVEQKSKSNF